MWVEMLFGVVLAGAATSDLPQAADQPASNHMVGPQRAGRPAQIALPAQRAVLAQRFPRQAGWSAGFGPGPFGAAAGPPMWGIGFGLGFAGPGQDDAGPVLVDLIQKTIVPGHWAPQGGPGAIYYWRPGRALIIRASQEAHEQIGDLLRQLERASR